MIVERFSGGTPVGGLIVHMHRHASKVAQSYRKRVAMFVEQHSQGVYISNPLMNQPLSAAEHRCVRLLVNRAGFNQVYLGLACCDHNRLCISRIIFLALHERVHVLRRDQFHLVPKRFQYPRPVICAAIGLENGQARNLLGHEYRKLLSRKLLSELYFLRSQGLVKPENMLCQINSDHHIVHLAIFSVVWP